MAAYYKNDKFGNLFCTDKNFDDLKEIEYIICLNRKEQASLKLFFFCCVCNKEIKGIRECRKHWTSAKHKDKADRHFKRTKHLAVISSNLSANQEHKITEYIENARYQALTQNELREREAVCQRIERILKDGGLASICCRLCGSSATGIGFHEAGVDINVQFDIEKISKLLPNVTDTSAFLLHIFDILQGHDDITSVEEFFHKRYPKITFTDKRSGLKCCIATIFHFGYQSTQLINKYLTMDGRVRKLCLAFKYWAKVCCLDDQESGSLPPTSFTIMVIHYLQQLTPPVLPVIEIPDQNLLPYNAIIDEKEERKFTIGESKIDEWKSRNNESLGMLFFRLFRYYLLDFHMKTIVITIRQKAPMTRFHRNFGSKRLAVEDPYLMKESMSNVMTSNNVMTYFFDSLETSFKYLAGCHQTTVELRKYAKKSRTESIKSFEKKRESKNKLEKKESEIKKEIANDTSIKEIALHDSIYHANINGDDSDVIIEITDDDSENDREKSYVKNKDGNLSESEEVEPKEVYDEIDANGRVSSDKEGSKMEDEVINQREDSAFSIQDDSLRQQGDITTMEVNQSISSISNSVIDLKYRGDVKNESKQGQISTENDEKREKEEEITELTDSVNGCEINGISEDTKENALVLPKVEERSKDLPESVDEPCEECHKESQSKDEKENSEQKEIGNADLSVTKNKIENERIIDGIQSDPLTVLSESNATVDNSDIYKTLHPQLPPDTSAYKENEAEDDEISAFVRDIIERIIRNGDIHSLTDNSTEFTNLLSNGHEMETTLAVDNDARVCKILKDNSQTKNDIEFIQRNLTPKRKVPIVCNICDSEEHYYKKCPLVKREYKPLKEPTKVWLSKVERVCHTVLQKHELTGKEFQIRLRAVEDIEDHLRKTFSADTRLNLFGSSVNGFGFKQSDMDICLRFSADEPPPGLNCAEEVVGISSCLSKDPGIRNVMYIKSAKVPIVKFKLPKRGLEGDISLYNSLAIYNSAMLATYGAVDERVRIMGYCIKVFVKTCEIGDASRGSLSSYAYILLVLHYLQRTEPPVIPILQELYDGDSKPEKMVEGWNAWFYQDIKNLRNVWKGFGRNNQSIGELWIGFFRFYVEKFNFLKDVVTTRRMARLTKFQKSWTRSSMAIEDPFNLSHNLGAGLTQKMFQYIMACFTKARERFGDRQQEVPEDIDPTGYFFNKGILTSYSDIPKDRLCHICERIGHTAANCAQKAANRRERRRRDSEREFLEDERRQDVQRTPGKRNDKAFTTTDDSNVKCHRCQKRGHKKKDCPKDCPKVLATRDSKTKSKSEMNSVNSWTPRKSEHNEGNEMAKTFVSDFEKMATVDERSKSAVDSTDFLIMTNTQHTPTQAKAENLLKTTVKSQSPEKFWNENQSQQPMSQVPSSPGYPFQPTLKDVQKINLLFEQRNGHPLQQGGYQLHKPFLFNQHLQQSLMQKPIFTGNMPYQHSNVGHDIRFDQHFLQQQQSLQAKIEEERQNQNIQMASEHNVQAPNVNSNIKLNLYLENTTQNDVYLVKPHPLSRNKNCYEQDVIQYKQIADTQQLYKDFPPAEHDGHKVSKKSHIQPAVQSSRNKDHGKQRQKFKSYPGPTQQNPQNSEDAGRLQSNSPKHHNGNKQRNTKNQQESVRQRHNSQSYQDPTRQRNDSQNYQELNHLTEKSVNYQNNSAFHPNNRQQTMDISNSFNFQTCANQVTGVNSPKTVESRRKLVYDEDYPSLPTSSENTPGKRSKNISEAKENTTNLTRQKKQASKKSGTFKKTPGSGAQNHVISGKRKNDKQSRGQHTTKESSNQKNTFYYQHSPQTK